MTRREFIGAIGTPALLPMVSPQGPRPSAQPNPVRVRVGMTDWNLGQRGDISKIALAREIGLDGIQVSVQYPTDGKTPTVHVTKA